jgi:hypothetical protein
MYRGTIKYLFCYIFVTACFVSVLQIGPLKAKTIQNKALEYATDYFSYKTAIKVIKGGDLKVALRTTGRNDFRTLRAIRSGKYIQQAHISLAPNFLMLVVIKRSKTGKVTAVTATRYDKDIPYSDIKFLAFSVKDIVNDGMKARSFAMGTSKTGGLRLIHRMIENAAPLGGNDKQVTWSFGAR